jgi:hypothetical protein
MGADRLRVPTRIRPDQRIVPVVSLEAPRVSTVGIPDRKVVANLPVDTVRLRIISARLVRDTIVGIVVIVSVDERVGSARHYQGQRGQDDDTR